MLDGDERLMMQIIDAEETYMTEWLEAQRGSMEAQIKEIDSLRASSKSLLRETNELRFLQVGSLNIMAVGYCDHKMSCTNIDGLMNRLTGHVQGLSWLGDP